jgi:hypothetical protein
VLCFSLFYGASVEHCAFSVVADLAPQQRAAESHAVHVSTMLAENVGHVRCERELSDELVVIGVSADPEPNEILSRLDCERAVVQPYARRPEPTHLFEMQRRVTRITLQVFV